MTKSHITVKASRAVAKIDTFPYFDMSGCISNNICLPNVDFSDKEEDEYGTSIKTFAMKTKSVICYLILLFVLCLLVWKTGDGFYVTPAYIVLSAIIIGIRKNLLNKLEV